MSTISLGRVFGFPVYVGWTALLVLGFLLFSRGLSSPADIGEGILFAVALFGSILVHELGHAVVGRRLGLAPTRILLHGFGGLCEFARSPKAREGVYATAAGPLAGLALGAVAFGVQVATRGQVPFYVTSWLSTIVWINVFWSLFNLLPMHPLDGGVVLWHALRLKLHTGRAWTITRNVSIATAGIVAVLGLLSHATFVVIVAALVLMQNLQR